MKKKSYLTYLSKYVYTISLNNKVTMSFQRKIVVKSTDKKKPKQQMPVQTCAGTGNSKCTNFSNTAGGSCARGGKCIIKNPSAVKVADEVHSLVAWNLLELGILYLKDILSYRM